MLPTDLPAKSKRPGEAHALSLEQHLLDTEQAASLMFSDAHRFGQNFRRFFRIPQESHQRFLLHVRIASLLHDLGKANEGFVAAVNGRSQVQTLRHEHLSALILHLPEVRKWLRQNAEIDWEVITAAVLSHHLKAERSGDLAWGQPRGMAQSVQLYLSHPQVERTLVRLAALAQLPKPPLLSETHWRMDRGWDLILLAGWDAADDLATDISPDGGKNLPRRALLAAVKAGVIAADAAASGLVRTDQDIHGWLTEICQQPAITDEELRTKIIAPRLEFIGKRSGSQVTLQPFQIEVAQQGERVLLLAGCGMGKTLAAWSWAEAQATQRSFSKVLFLYPTRGTATEGFRDYVGWAPETEASLMHGSARYELEEMLSNPSDATNGKKYEPDERLFALGLWSRRFFSATVDQFLSFLENQYSALCMIPVLGDSVVIVDEVHSFDPHMFDLLVALLREFDVPVLCMTATLPESRRRSLTQDAGLSVFPTETQSEAIADLKRKEAKPRYRHVPLTSAEAALEHALSSYRSGQRVLWVVNQVGRCQYLARRLSEILSETVLCYHSRFRLGDRRDRHKDTVAAFAFQSGVVAPALAVTTQVCEMSLDLDADVLITEWAPVSALVQRFGRANRHLKRGDSFRATLHTYRPERDLPYDREQLKAAECFLSALSGADISQEELATKLLLHSPKEPRPDGSARFLTGGYFAVPGSFRDAEELSFGSILDKDLAAVEAHRCQRKPIDSFIVPVPRSSRAFLDATPSFLPKHLRVVDHRFYDEKLGFLAESQS